MLRKIPTSNANHTWTTGASNSETLSCSTCGVIPATTVSKSSDAVLLEWFDRYEKSSRPIKVNFRKMVPNVKIGERATHYIHPYPAKLLPHIAAFFASSDMLSQPGDTILDPFGGSGTVGLEAMIAGRSAFLVDPNPLARAIAEAKTTPLSERKVAGAISRIRKRFRTRKVAPQPDVVNLSLWYHPKALRPLRRLLWAVEQEKDPQVRNFLAVSFSSLARKASFTDPRLTVPVRPKRKSRTPLQKPGTDISMLNAFLDLLRQNSVRMRSLVDSLPSDVSTTVIGTDARQLEKCLPSSTQVPLIITSPPYGGAQKYVRATSLSLGWLRMAVTSSLRVLEDQTIGREHFPKAVWSAPLPKIAPQADRAIARIAKTNRIRACIAATYLQEMSAACTSMVHALAPGGHLVLVIGNNTVQGSPFLASRFLADMLTGAGLIVRVRLIDDIKSRGLMTKRNKTASMITREWVLIFQKPAESKTCTTR